MEEEYKRATQKATEAFKKFIKREITYEDFKRAEDESLEKHRKWHTFLADNGNAFLPSTNDL